MAHPTGLNVTDRIFSPWDVEGAQSRPAIYYLDEVWTYRRLIDEIHRVAGGLASLDLQPEQRLLLMAYDSPFFVALFFGAMKVGAVPVPVNTNLTAGDYLYFLEDSQARVLAVEPDLWVQLAPHLRGRAKALKAVILLPSPTENAVSITLGYPGPLFFYREWADRFAPRFSTAATSSDSIAFWLYSSGSTGRPKAAVHLHKDILVCNECYGQGVLGIQPSDRLYSASKLFFAYGLGNGSYFALANGASAVLVPDRVTPEHVLKTIERHRPTLFFGVPTLYNAMLRADPGRTYDLSSLRACVSAGEPLPGEIYTRWKDRYGVEILDGIGSTEVLHIYISNWPGRSRPGVTGRVVPGYEVKIVDETGMPVGPDVVGDLYVKGESTAAFYWNQAEKTRTSMMGEWFRTGDKFIQDAQGVLTYCGRSDDMIKVGGIWVSPIEVENVLLIHEAVAEAAVVGMVGDDGLERPVAYVVVNSGYQATDALAQTLQAFVRERLAHFKYPREIRFVSELPKTASGKIQRFRLRQGVHVG